MTEGPAASPEEEEMDDLRAAVAEAIRVVEQEAAESQEAQEARAAENNTARPSTQQEEIKNSFRKAVTTVIIFYKD